MSSQFEKRKAKIEAELKEKRAEIREKAEEPAVVAPPEPVKAPAFTHEGFDIFLDGRYFKAVTFKYNPATRAVEIIDIAPIERAVGLSYENQKRALRTLLRKK